MYDPVTSLPNRLHFRAEADKLIAARGAGSALGDAVRRPRSLQARQRQHGPCAGRPIAADGRQSAAQRRQCRDERDWRVAPAVAGAARGRRIHHLRVGHRLPGGRRARCAANRAGDRRAVRAPRPQHRHRRVGRGRADPRPRPQHRDADARRRYCDVLREGKRRQPILPLLDRTGRPAPGQDRYRGGASRGAPARRIRAGDAAPVEPRQRRDHRRRGVAALEPSARRPAPARQFRAGRRSVGLHRRDRRMGDRRKSRR